jgi:tetratricopeptide (TPR) repeat protein
VRYRSDQARRGRQDHRFCRSGGGAGRAARGGLLLTAVLSAGCATGLGRFGSKGITPAELLAGAPLGVAQDGSPAIIAPADVMALSPEMRAFLGAHVDSNASDGLKVKQLVGAIIGTSTLGLTYDERTRTAAETFRARRGNCMSFSTLFVAMAREVGLNAQFQEVDIPPDWTVDKDTFVLNRHVDVRVALEPVGTQVVDFNTANFRSSYDMRTISDTLAMAQFYNNMGVERMQDGDTAAALANFRQALAGDDRLFSPAWTNLGTLYLRHAQLAYAEAAYLQALRADSSNLVAMSNLARLYEREGDSARAARFRRRVIRHRWHNPYYRYQLAREAFAAGRYDTAISHLKYAIRQKQNEEWFYSLLSQCYEREGNERAARHWRERAQRIASSQPLKPAGSDQADAPSGH